MPIKPAHTATHGISASIYLDTYDASYYTIYYTTTALHQK
jgi:hypothetical protein